MRFALADTVPVLAVIFAVVWAFTPTVETANVAVEDPLETTTPLGTVAEVELLNRVTKTPVPTAFEFSVTVPVALVPPCTEAGLTETELTTTG